MSHYLYRHIRPDKNEPFYIGIGKEGTKRAWEIRDRTGLWNNIVNKNNGHYKVEILFNGLTKEEVNTKEIEFIALYGKKSDGTGSLVNFQVGGSNHTGWKMPEDQKERLREIIKNRTCYTGHVWTEEERVHASISRKGRKGPNKDRILSEEVKQNMSKGHMGNKSTKGKIWINNGVNKKLILKDSIIPEGWIKEKKFNGIYLQTIK